MTSGLAEKLICEGCGVEARGGATFCYNCGEKIEAEQLPPPISKPLDEISRSFAADALPPVAVPSVSPTEPVVPPEPRKRSRQPRTVKVAEVEWVTRPPASKRFVIGAAVIGAITVLLLAAALYLK